MTTGKRCGICRMTTVLAGLGALNWGLVGLFQVNLVERLLGGSAMGERIVYGVIGLAGLMTLVSLVVCCPCKKRGEPACSSETS